MTSVSVCESEEILHQKDGSSQHGRVERSQADEQVHQSSLTSMRAPPTAKLRQLNDGFNQMSTSPCQSVNDQQQSRSNVLNSQSVLSHSLLSNQRTSDQRPEHQPRDVNPQESECFYPAVSSTVQRQHKDVPVLSLRRQESEVPQDKKADPFPTRLLFNETDTRSYLSQIVSLPNEPELNKIQGSATTNQYDFQPVSTVEKSRMGNPTSSIGNFRSSNQQNVSSLNPDQIAARHVLPRELPKFYGSPKEWPMFISSYESSTATGGYTNAENLIRLQRCLKGEALEAVRSILLSPENVQRVIETLRMMYGRPDIIIFTMIQQVREEQPPKLEKLESIINFALVVRNLCAIIEATHLEAHKNNPYLIQEIMDKLPSSMRLEWSRFKRTLPSANMQDLGDWLYEVAQAASDVVTPTVSHKDKGKNNKKDEPKPKKKEDKFMVAYHKESIPTDTSTSSAITSGGQKCMVCQLNCNKVIKYRIARNFKA